MSAGAADRRNPSAGGTLRLSAIALAEERTTIGRYRILSELGEGAMGKVYLALDPNINRKVALKVLQPRGIVSAVDMEDLRTRFLLEARAAGSLRHPAAVAIYDADHDPESGLSYIAMEWIDGKSLDKCIKESGRLPIERAISIVAQVASALDAAHHQGLIHRDVKPANILIDHDGQAKLSDFGIAKIEALEITSTGQVLGTPNFMSPEQIRDLPLDGRSDQFSLAVVLYQCVTGVLPFTADSLPALTHKILNVDPRPAREHNPDLSEPVSATLLKALAKEPAQRFDSMSQMAQALGAKLEPLTATIELTHPSLRAVLDVGPKAARAKRTWILAGLGLLVLTLLALVTANFRSQAIRPSRPVLAKHERPATAPPGAISTTREIADDAATSETVVGTASLQISYTNRLKQAHLEVWIDGEKRIGKSVYRPKGLLRRATGTLVFETLEVAPGHHDVKVSIRGAEGKIEASNWSGNDFYDGQTRRLRVELIPPSYLNLAWKEP